MILNEELTIRKSEIKNIEELPEVLENKFGSRILRWFISKVAGDEISIEITLLGAHESASWSSPLSPVEALYPGKSVVVNIVPTGIGCDIGGYAADAAPASALLASCTDYLITNPNTVNASNFIFMTDNVLYTEGYIIDQFCKGLINLYRPYSNKVGLIVNKPDKSELDMVFNIMNTVRAVHGVDIENYFITDESMGGSCVQNKSGSYVGRIENPDVLFNACDYLVEKGVNAIAVTSNIKDLPLDYYAEHFEGRHPNPIGGAEAVISHLICKRYGLPAAHAPLLNVKELALASRIVDARGAGEFASTSGLACVLIGLSRAPQMTKNRCRGLEDIVNVNNLLAVVAPAGALGGIPVLYAARNGIPVIAVRENKTILQVTQSKLNLKNVIEVTSYPEAAGILLALKKGISIPSLYRPLSTLRTGKKKGKEI
jgi:hypothetical protein